MSKKRKPEKRPEKKNKNTKNIIIALTVLLVVASVVVALQLKSTSDKASDSVAVVDDNSLWRGETRPTLSPLQFSNPFVAGAYQIAEDIPRVLDSVKCYCFCDREPFNHKSLLSCYVDTHAAG